MLIFPSTRSFSAFLLSATFVAAILASPVKKFQLPTLLPKDHSQDLESRAFQDHINGVEFRLIRLVGSDPSKVEFRGPRDLAVRSGELMIVNIGAMSVGAPSGNGFYYASRYDDATRGYEIRRVKLKAQLKKQVYEVGLFKERLNFGTKKHRDVFLKQFEKAPARRGLFLDMFDEMKIADSEYGPILASGPTNYDNVVQGLEAWGQHGDGLEHTQVGGQTRVVTNPDVYLEWL
ncbi:hypothetical protein EV361DRAFT_881596 [Lentinula raphanica]|uniref:Uncharacterized protein n=1 Tax=Lentinula raphanica TaxID=153919 RepID=A0AA38NYC5_9AGAR|nr:hypothetical protein F5878DRAFT_634488 [Lentinula raphanica]KAJ3976869.1 hypothetical protein EV361DRAFT_881596 [Lentinula raphanica]